MNDLLKTLHALEDDALENSRLNLATLHENTKANFPAGLEELQTCLSEVADKVAAGYDMSTTIHKQAPRVAIQQILLTELLASLIPAALIEMINVPKIEFDDKPPEVQLDFAIKALHGLGRSLTERIHVSVASAQTTLMIRDEKESEDEPNP